MPALADRNPWIDPNRVADPNDGLLDEKGDRAASGTIRAEIEDIECFQEDADGPAKVAIIDIEHSIAAWATLLSHFPDHKDAIFSLHTLKRLLRQVEAAFPNARTFRRPGFDTTE